MASTKTRIKGIRVTNECVDYFEGKPLNRMVESLMELIEKGVVAYDDTGLKILKDRTGVNTSSEAYVDLVSMLDCYGLSIDQFISEADRCMNDGAFSFEGDCLKCVLPGWAEKLSDACHELGYDVEKIAESAVKSLGKGML